MSSIPPAELQSQKDHLYQDATHRLSAFFIACIVLSVLFVAMRVASRLTMRVRLRADDYTIIVGTVIAIGSFVVLIIYCQSRSTVLFSIIADITFSYRGWTRETCHHPHPLAAHPVSQAQLRL